MHIELQMKTELFLALLREQLELRDLWADVFFDNIVLHRIVVGEGAEIQPKPSPASGASLIVVQPIRIVLATLVENGNTHSARVDADSPNMRVLLEVALESGETGPTLSLTPAGVDPSSAREHPTIARLLESQLPRQPFRVDVSSLRKLIEGRRFSDRCAVTASTDLTRISLRLELADADPETDDSWLAFSAGAVPDLLDGSDWGVFLAGELVADPLRQVLLDNLSKQGFKSSSTQSAWLQDAGGGPRLTLTLNGELIDYCWWLDIDLEVRASARFDVEASDTLTVTGDVEWFPTSGWEEVVCALTKLGTAFEWGSFGALLGGFAGFLAGFFGSFLGGSGDQRPADGAFSWEATSDHSGRFTLKYSLPLGEMLGGEGSLELTGVRGLPEGLVLLGGLEVGSRSQPTLGEVGLKSPLVWQVESCEEPNTLLLRGEVSVSQAEEDLPLVIKRASVIEERNMRTGNRPLFIVETHGLAVAIRTDPDAPIQLERFLAREQGFHLLIQTNGGAAWMALEPPPRLSTQEERALVLGHKAKCLRLFQEIDHGLVLDPKTLVDWHEQLVRLCGRLRKDTRLVIVTKDGRVIFERAVSAEGLFQIGAWMPSKVTAGGARLERRRDWRWLRTANAVAPRPLLLATTATTNTESSGEAEAAASEQLCVGVSALGCVGRIAGRGEIRHFGAGRVAGEACLLLTAASGFFAYDLAQPSRPRVVLSLIEPDLRGALPMADGVLVWGERGLALLRLDPRGRLLETSILFSQEVLGAVQLGQDLFMLGRAGIEVLERQPAQRPTLWTRPCASTGAASPRSPIFKTVASVPLLGGRELASAGDVVAVLENDGICFFDAREAAQLRWRGRRRLAGVSHLRRTPNGAGQHGFLATFADGSGSVLDASRPPERESPSLWQRLVAALATVLGLGRPGREIARFAPEISGEPFVEIGNVFVRKDSSSDALLIFTSVAEEHLHGYAPIA
ncbi:MAG: hypothetical protein HC897_03510 [Thermoanaerobaculia bacterium]|nr:hypothetical protein [Thermoanaerobaculia bacterium]